jgi:mycothiol synthase
VTGLNAPINDCKMRSSTSLTRHQYAGEDDLTALLDFASRSLAARFPLGATWHPGDIAWELRGQYGAKQAIRFWEVGGDVQAVAWFVGSNEVWVEALPAAETLIADAVAWAERSLRRRQATDQTMNLSVRAFHRDGSRIEHLQRLGFAQAGLEGVQFEFDLAATLPDVLLPDGFWLIDSGGVDVEQRAASHRDAWSALDHIGIAGAKSAFSADVYENLRASPPYRASLDLAVVAPDGSLAANCICWADDSSGIGIFEPMGTHPTYRGQRLSRALLAEGMRRLQGLGHRRARIATAPFNTSAIAAYSSVFQLFDRSSWWSKSL